MNKHVEIHILDGNETNEMLLALSRGESVDSVSGAAGFNAESRAMIQSLYSRSPKSVIRQLENVMESGASNFMGKFYVSYGHKSIGDCGYITIFVEQVSMFVAKAIQDNRLYSGQEASTRYLDFSQQPIIDPVGTPESKTIIDTWMQFYEESGEPLREFLKEKYPQKEGEDDGTYERAIKARSFDILRGFLPSGSTTLLAWTTNLRQAADKLHVLMYHPMQEVRDVAHQIHQTLQKKYPNSFSHEVRDEQIAYYKDISKQYFHAPDACTDFSFEARMDLEAIEKYKDLLKSRPKYTELPHWMDELGQCEVHFLLDFGSYRDVQRHRAGIVRMPLLETRWGFHQWYLEQLSADLKKQAEELIKTQNEMIESLDCSKEDKQYYIPMGYNVPVKLTFQLPGIVYLAELRSGKTVHATLRQRAHQLADALEKNIPHLTLHADRDPDDWDIRRGNQTIMDAEGKAISD